MQSYNLKAGQSLTVVMDASTTGQYSLIGDGNNAASGNTALSASSTTVIGPFSNDRRYRVDIISGVGMSASQAYSTDAADIAVLTASIAAVSTVANAAMIPTSLVHIKSVKGAVAAGGAAAQSFTDAYCTTASVVIGNWVTQANAVNVLTIVPGTGSFIVTSSSDAGAGTFSYSIIK